MSDLATVNPDDPPEGYTRDQWAGMRRAAAVLDLGHVEIARAKPLRDLGIPVPEVEQNYRRSQDGLGRPTRVRVPNKTYLIRCGEFVKIGITADVHLRLRTLEAYNPMPLVVVALFSGGRELERDLHLRFAAYRHRDEWFKIEGELATWIDAGCSL